MMRIQKLSKVEIAKFTGKAGNSPEAAGGIEFWSSGTCRHVYRVCSSAEAFKERAVLAKNTCVK